MIETVDDRNGGQLLRQVSQGGAGLPLPPCWMAFCPPSGLPMLDEIRGRFGPRVADIVEGCTDAVVVPKPPWRKRKEDYIEHLASAPPQTLLVSLADKLFNARSILLDYRRVGPAVWDRFHAGRDDQLWYYRQLADTFMSIGDSVPHVLASELDRLVTEIERLPAGRPGSPVT